MLCSNEPDPVPLYQTKDLVFDSFEKYYAAVLTILFTVKPAKKLSLLLSHSLLLVYHLLHILLIVQQVT